LSSAKLLLDRIAFCSASESAFFTHFSVADVVCLSHSCPCLNSLTDLDAIWQLAGTLVASNWVKWWSPTHSKEKYRN